jgi:carbonic anhydrase/acetyltransferase-like protein (isoleucine patch superfamily)
MQNILPYCGDLPKLGERVFIAPTATLIGDVVVGDDANIWFGCVLRGDVNVIRVGERTNIQDGTIVHVSKDGSGAYIGSDVTIGHMVLLHACTLESGCFIGMRATLMDDVVVEAGAMIAAGALVTPGKRIGSGQLWGGAPARYMRDVAADDRRIMERTGPRYVGLARDYLALAEPPRDLR